MIDIKLNRLPHGEGLPLPARATEHAAGLDVVAAEEVTLGPGQRHAVATGFAIANLQERGSLFIAPGDELYEGMVVGENSRDNDLDVNASKPKKLSNMRAASSDELVRLIPPRPLSVELALEFIRADEAIEVTPQSIRLRKVELSASMRQTLAGRAKRERTATAHA